MKEVENVQKKAEGGGRVKDRDGGGQRMEDKGLDRKKRTK